MSPQGDVGDLIRVHVSSGDVSNLSFTVSGSKMIQGTLPRSAATSKACFEAPATISVPTAASTALLVRTTTVQKILIALPRPAAAYQAAKTGSTRPC